MKKYKSETEKGIVHLWDLPENKVYLRLEDVTRKNLFERILKDFKLTKLALFLHKNPNHFYIKIWKYKSGKVAIPLKLINFMLNLLSEKEKSYFEKRIERSLIVIKLGRAGKFLKNPKFPIRFSLPLMRIISHTIGDGGSSEKRSYEVYYTNQSLELIEKFENDIQTAFGTIKPYKYYDRRDNTITVCFPGIIGLILTKLTGVQSGDLKHVPEELKNMSKSIKAAFLKALFDDEGCPSVSDRKIQLMMANENIITDVKELLKEFNIKPTKTTRITIEGFKNKFEFCVCSYRDLKIFSNEIGFDHLEKEKKLEALLQNYKSFQRRNMEFRNELLETLRLNGEMNVFQIAEALNIKSVNGLRKELWRLEQKFIIKGEIKGRYKIYSV